MKLRSLLLVMLALVLVAGITPLAPVHAEATKAALVRFVNASSDASAFDVYLNDSTFPIVANLDFGQYSVFTEIAAGTYDIVLRKAKSNASSDPIFSKTGVDITTGQSTTLVAMGLLKETGDSAFDLKSLPEDRDIPSGQARLAVVHAVPGGPNLDVTNDGKAIITDLKYLQFDKIDLDPGKPTLAIAETGKTQSLLDLTGADLSADTLYTLLVIGTPQKIDYLVLESSNNSGFLRVVHASPDAPAIDVYVDETTNSLLQGLSYKDVTNYIEIGTGTYTITVREAGADPKSDPIYTFKNVKIEQGQSVIIAAFGMYKATDQTAFRMASFPVDRSALSGQTRIQAIHLISDQGPLDFLEGSSKVDALSGLEFGSFVTLKPLDPTKTSLGIAPQGSTDAVVAFDNYQLDGDMIYTFLAIGTSQDPHLLVVSSRPDVYNTTQ